MSGVRASTTAPVGAAITVPMGRMKGAMRKVITWDSTFAHLDEGEALPPLVRMVPSLHAAAHGLALSAA
jgi:hypothetical protein